LQRFTRTGQALGIEPTLAGRYRPRTGGKTRRLIQTCRAIGPDGRVWARNAGRISWFSAFLSHFNPEGRIRPWATNPKPPDSAKKRGQFNI
jgi:hypothetical protein